MIVDCLCTHCIEAGFDDLCITEDRNNRIRMDKIKDIDQNPDSDHDNDEDDDEEDQEFMFRNLDAERRMRLLLNDRFYQLRTLVLNITNLDKASISSDAITYIKELQKSVKDLSGQEIDAEEEPDVHVNHICGTQLRIKIVFQKKKGGLTKLMEAIIALGFDLTDVSITTFKRAVLFTSSAEGMHGGKLDADKIKKHLLEIIRSN